MQICNGCTHLVQLMGCDQLCLLSGQLWLFKLSREWTAEWRFFAVWRAVGCILMSIACSVKFEGRSWRGKKMW